MATPNQGGRGGFNGNRDGRGRGRGQGNRGHHGGGPVQGPGQGRGRGRGMLTQDQKATIVVAKREFTLQIAGEGTDDVVLAAAADEKLQHNASFILNKDDFVAFTGQRQIRNFVNSCLLNLSNHHNIDTSGILTSLSKVSGRARLREIMLMPMHIDAGDSKDLLSFQYVVLPLIGVFTRESVCQSTLTSESGIIYSTVFSHQRQFLDDGVMRCMDQLLERRSMADFSAGGQRLLNEQTSICHVTSLPCALLAIVRLVYQLIKRFQDAQTAMADLVAKLRTQQIKCLQVASSSAEDRFFNENLAREVTRLEQIITDARDKIIEPLHSAASLTSPQPSRPRGPNMVHLVSAYDPPGHLSPKGSRHDNDHAEISKIILLPTEQEIASPRDPFLPSNDISEAPHFLPPGWRRQLDIHFRLYREDMIDSLRKGLMSFSNVLQAIRPGEESILLKQKELKKRLDDNISLDVYGDVHMLGMDTTKQTSVGSVEISFGQPPRAAAATTHQQRVEFWERSRRRLMQGSLICLASRSDNNRQMEDAGHPPFQMILGVVTKRDTAALAKDNKAARIHISLADPKAYLTMLNIASQSKKKQWFLVESMGGFFESYRPILKALQNCVPASLPFGKYLAPTAQEQEGTLAAGEVAVDPPLYARAPGFTFDLSVLLKGQRCQLDVLSQDSVTVAINMLQRQSTLDDTQASALVETLCREVALISGPPGTGKTKIGVDLMRVLLHNKQAMNCGPILCICYTNHALDQFLEHLLDEGIKSIVRIGARSKSERLEDYNLESLKMARDRPFSVRQVIKKAHEDWEIVSKKIQNLEKALRNETLDWEYVGTFLMNHNEDQWEQLDYHGYTSAAWNEDIASSDDSDSGEFTTVGGKSKSRYVRWITGADIDEKRRLNKVAAKAIKKNAVPLYNAFGSLQIDGSSTRQVQGRSTLHHIPNTDRPLHQLTGDLWEMSLNERRRLLDSWKPEVLNFMMQSMSRLLIEVEKISQAKNNANDDIRRTILRETSVIGMTTNGAAKLQTLISAVAPKIIICEEAGEVLESHILAALSASTQHLVLIGDHKQLRPQIETYTLSSDSTIGKNYNLDKSLFERLVDKESKKNPLPLSHLTIQRRMRPEISSLIRNTLYPDLADGERVFAYPDVSGMGANLYFMDHAHAEDSKDQYGAQSFANSFEVRMVGALAQYLIKNGYDKPGDIAVLTPYLGQLSKLRDHLRKSFFLMIDERDQDQLDLKGREKEQDETIAAVNEQIGVKKVGLQNHLTLRTIDNYQGEEAKIVIITLVRSNSKENGTSTAGGSIGFLKSPNRTNVLLSRAQHGMFLIGNAGLMEGARSGMWQNVLQELRQFDRVRSGFPIVCKNHPEITNIVDEPEAFKIVAPNAGCTAACGRGMPCGHVCPLQCHPDDKDHVLVKCFEPCPQLQPGCDHVCPKVCGEKCGNCMEFVSPILLACGHIFDRPRCWQAKNPSKILCKVQMARKLSTCEHEHILSCHMDPSAVVCDKPCNEVLGCGHICTRPCSECQKESPGWKKKKDNPAVRIERTVHGKCKKECGRNLFCGHPCISKCHDKAACPPCGQKCEVFCAHSRCHQKCNAPCAACCQRCVWSCQHQGQCEMPCGAPCDRLPCNKRCDKELKCGHQCPSICGEKCPSEKFCVECKDPSTMGQIVDLIMQQSLAEVDIDDDPILVLACGHALTMTTLDGMMGMSEYYVAETDKKTGDVQYVGKKDLTNDEVPQVSCPNCRKPIIGILRYGRRVKCSQLRLRSHKHEITQFGAMTKAQQAFDVAQVQIRDRHDAFIASLTKGVTEECPEPPSAELRVLGRHDDKNVELPNSNVESIENIYRIPKLHADAWVKMISPATKSLYQFGEISIQGFKSPTKRLFDAAVSHLYRIKTTPTYDLSEDLVTHPSLPRDAATASDIVQACVVECGLPRDGHFGESYVNSLQERANVLIFVISQAFEAMDKCGASTGWYWFVEDLLRCARIHIEKLQTASLNGRFSRKAVYAQITHMDLICRETRWLGMKTFPTEDKAKEDRLKQVNSLQEKFMAEHKDLKDHCPRGIKIECVARAEELEAKMVEVVKAAKGQASYSPLSKEEKLQLFRAMSQELRGSGHWYACPNGHPYVIGECGMAMEQAHCAECGALIGGGDHALRGDNVLNTEFEDMYRQRR